MKNHVAWILRSFDGELAENVQQQTEADLNLGTRKCGTEAIVNSVPKPNTAPCAAIEAQNIRISKTCGITIGRTQYGHHPRAARNVAASQAHVSVRPPSNRLHRSIESN
nr:hypothetical protein [Mycobacteroides salmoniphilum]